MEIEYANAKTGQNEYLSAVILDALDNIKYYGRIKKLDSDDSGRGSAIVNINNIHGVGDTLYIFNEQINDNGKTDFASVMRPVAVPTVQSDDPDNPVDIKECDFFVPDMKYTGKPCEPQVDVWYNGQLHEAGVTYEVEYSKNVNVGNAKATVSGKGLFTGSVELAFKVLPKGTTLKTIKGKSKAAKVTWKKQKAKMSKSRITGYEIVLATDSDFTSNVKTVPVKGFKKTAKTVKKLKAKTKYFIKIRTYKTINGNKIYSDWSNVRTVKTK